LAVNLCATLFIAGFEEILQGAAVCGIGFRFLGELDVFEVRRNRIRQPDPIGCALGGELETGRFASEDLLLSLASGGGCADVLSNRLPDAPTALVPFQIIGAFGVTFLPSANEDVVRLYAAVRRYNDGTEARALSCFGALGEVISLFT
jgi:hypothetical protein